VSSEPLREDRRDGGCGGRVRTTSVAHTGTYAARVGSAAITNADLSVLQAFTAPTGTTTTTTAAAGAVQAGTPRWQRACRGLKPGTVGRSTARSVVHAQEDVRWKAVIGIPDGPATLLRQRNYVAPPTLRRLSADSRCQRRHGSFVAVAELKSLKATDLCLRVLGDDVALVNPTDVGPASLVGRIEIALGAGVWCRQAGGKPQGFFYVGCQTAAADHR
jgi:hypothetical protein